MNLSECNDMMKKYSSIPDDKKIQIIKNVWIDKKLTHMSVGKYCFVGSIRNATSPSIPDDCEIVQGCDSNDILSPSIDVKVGKCTFSDIMDKQAIEAYKMSEVCQGVFPDKYSEINHCDFIKPSTVFKFFQNIKCDTNKYPILEITEIDLYEGLDLFILCYFVGVSCKLEKFTLKSRNPEIEKSPNWYNYTQYVGKEKLDKLMNSHNK